MPRATSFMYLAHHGAATHAHCTHQKPMAQTYTRRNSGAIGAGTATASASWVSGAEAAGWASSAGSLGELAAARGVLADGIGASASEEVTVCARGTCAESPQSAGLSAWGERAKRDNGAVGRIVASAAGAYRCVGDGYLWLMGRDVAETQSGTSRQPASAPAAAEKWTEQEMQSARVHMDRSSSSQLLSKVTKGTNVRGHNIFETRPTRPGLASLPMHKATTQRRRTHNIRVAACYRRGARARSASTTAYSSPPSPPSSQWTPPPPAALP